MDAFTENILVRARERQKMLEGYSGTEKTPLRENNKDTTTHSSTPNLREVKSPNRKQIVSDPALETTTTKYELKENKSETNLTKFTRQNSTTRVSSEISGSPQQLKTLNIQKDNFNMEIKVTSSENIRVEVEIEEHSDNDSESGTNDACLRDESKNKLKRLGKLYAGGDDADISSPIHKTEAKFYENDSKDIETALKVRDTPKCKKGLSKLADLAQSINQWEDDVHTTRPVTEKTQPSMPKKAWKPPAPQPPTVPSPPKPSPAKPSQKPKAPDPPALKQTTVVKSMVEAAEKAFAGSGDSKKADEGKKIAPKQLKWDQNVLDKLESQGFTRTESSSRLVYAYNSQEKRSESEAKTAQIAKKQQEFKRDVIIEENEPTDDLKPEKIVSEKQKIVSPSKTSVKQGVTVPFCPKSPSKPSFRSTQIASKAALFESSPTKPKDPALLSVSERKALFEKNRGAAPLPKAPISLNVPPKSTNSKIHTEQNVKPNVASEKIGASPSKTGKYQAPKPPLIEKIEEQNKKTVAAVHQDGGIASKVAALLESKSTISQEQIENNVKEQRQKEMDMLLNRFQKNKEVQNVAVPEEESEDERDATEETVMLHHKPATIVSQPRRSGEKRKSGGKPYGTGDSPIVTSVLDDVKRIKVSGPKEGKLYPSISDIETATETETDNRTRSPSSDGNSSYGAGYDSDNPNTSFGREILQAVCSNQTPQKRPIYDESTASDVSSILDDLDDYMGEPSEDDTSAGPTPPKQSRHCSPKVSAKPSSSFHYKNCSPSVSTPKTKFQSPVKIITSPKRQVELPTYIVEGDNVLPLTHTVSFYRRQQNQVKTPVRQITRQPLIEESPEKSVEADAEAIEKKLVELQDEVNKQQNIIAQTSQALNLCSATLEFSGSTEQVEAERVLLVATHRRQAALHELQRLKVERTIRPQGPHSQSLPLEKGSLTISNIVLPLKQKYVKALAAAGGKGHHVVCLVKCGEQVVPTKLVSTVVNNAKNPDVDLYVPGSVTLNDIYSDFTVTFEVYCLQAQEEFLPHEVKYHINNKKSGTKLGTPKKSKQDSKMVMPIKESPAGPQAVRTSSFALMGYVVFSVQAVNKKSFTLNNTPSMSPLEGSVEMRINCELAVSVEHRGFLTMFEDVSGFGAWHRRWCLLKGHVLSYWKYPDDERKTAPIDTIDLKNCLTKQVGPVSKEICARINTFLLERERLAHPQDRDTLVMICKGDKTIIRHLLSADTKEERNEWCSKLNAALTELRMWGNAQ